MPKLLMTVIRFCVPCDNHMIKKLMLVYWEVIDKTGPDGAPTAPRALLALLAPLPRAAGRRACGVRAGPPADGGARAQASCSPR